MKINFTNKALLTVYWQNYKFYFWCLHTLVIYFRFESHDAFYRLLANQRNIQILDVEHEKIRDSCQALFQPMPKLEEGLILRLLKLALTTLILYSCQSKIQNQHSDQSDTACYAGYQSECSGTQLPGRTQNVSFLGRRYFKLPILSCPRIPPATQATFDRSFGSHFLTSQNLNLYKFIYAGSLRWQSDHFRKLRSVRRSFIGAMTFNFDTRGFFNNITI